MNCYDCVCNTCEHGRCFKFRCDECDRIGMVVHEECVNEVIKELDRYEQ